METPPAHDSDLDATLPDFVPERRLEDARYAAVVCDCGHRRFLLSGWTRIATAGGSFFWRSLTRVWREARVAMEDGEPAESPFWLPLFLRCEACGREITVGGEEDLGPVGESGRWPVARYAEPRESFRCRVCRRAAHAVVVGRAFDARLPERMDLEVVVRCDACHRQHRVAWLHDRPSDQEVQLDLLYGRR